MANTTMTYRGHEVVIGGVAGAPHLSIDGDAIPVSRLEPDLYATMLLPYTNFPSLEALAHALIDHSPHFNGRRDVT